MLPQYLHVGACGSDLLVFSTAVPHNRQIASCTAGGGGLASYRETLPCIELMYSGYAYNQSNYAIFMNRTFTVSI
jgi:hypothetical protein